MRLRLLITPGAYALQRESPQGWDAITSLPGGAQALLGPRQAVDEGTLESAIAAVEDWVMPQAPLLRGAVLAVHDEAGRLLAGLEAVLGAPPPPAWDVAAVEAAFLELVRLATGRRPAPVLQGCEPVVADVLLLRELAHHGQVAQLRLR